MQRNGLLSIFLILVPFHLPGCLVAHEADHKTSNLCEEIVLKDGYPCQNFTVTTADGFVLGLYRISHEHDDDGKTTSRQPVFLQHGLFQGAEVWVLNLRNQSLAYILADHGFDVWIGSSRGTRWSRGHVSHPDYAEEYWDWSWDELAAFDLPASLALVYSTTGVKAFYVGHSQGTIIGFAALTQKVVADFLGVAAFLSPITYLNHITAELVNALAHSDLEKLAKGLGIYEFNPRTEFEAKIIGRFCSSRQSNCEGLIEFFTGPNCCINTSRIPYYLQYEPQSTSTKNLGHLAQMVRDGSFSKYDYGFLGNLLHYRKFSPPTYDLSNIPISLPLWMASGANDALTDPTDLAHTLAELPSQPLVLYLEGYGHLDAVLGVQAKEDIYDEMIAFFKSKIS